MKLKYSYQLFLGSLLALSPLLMWAQQNAIGLNVSGERFSRAYDATHAVALTYSRETSLGLAFGRLNYSNRFQRSGTQYEFDWYPGIVKGTYLYVNYGYSASTLFPEHRAGLEIYHSLPASFEASLGVRYLNFRAGGEVKIYTGSLGYYWGNFYGVVRTFLTPGSSGTSRSLNFTVRRYFADADEFAFIRLGGGVSPDEQQTQSSLGSRVYDLASQSVSAGWQSGFHNDMLFDAQLGWTNQELIFSPGNFVTSFTLSAGIRYRF